jgi:hypothetical protein
MIARYFTEAERGALHIGDPVAYLTGGGTKYTPATFVGISRAQGGVRAIIRKEGAAVDSLVKLESLGPLAGRIEEARS